MDEEYDLILSIGQVVPHEVVGMANHAKNLFVGVGGSEMINASHMVGAVYGIERMMGKDHTPVRKLFDYALEHFLKTRPILFVLTVTTAPAGEIRTGCRKEGGNASLPDGEDIYFIPNPALACGSSGRNFRSLLKDFRLICKEMSENFCQIQKMHRCR